MTTKYGIATGGLRSPLAFGAGLFNYSTATINNSTFSGNRASGWGGGIGNEGVLTINNSTISSNTERYGGVGNYTGTVIFQNSIVANTLLSG